MVRLWERMSEIYGPRWAAGYGEPGGKAFKTWSNALSKATPERVRRGLGRCLRRDDKGWPPTLPEFMGMCEVHTHPSHRQALDHQINKAPKEVAEAAMKTVRDLIAGTGVVNHPGGAAGAGNVHGGHA